MECETLTDNTANNDRRQRCSGVDCQLYVEDQKL